MVASDRQRGQTVNVVRSAAANTSVCVACSLRLLQRAIDVEVVVQWIVVKQGECADTRLLRQPHRVLGRAMPPRRLHRELFGCVLRVVDQQVGAVTQFEHGIRRGHLPIRWLLMIADVDDARAVPLHPVPHHRADMGNETSHDVHRLVAVADVELAGLEIVELDLAGDPVQRNREQRGSDRRLHHIGHGVAAGLTRRVHIELGSVTKQRREEGETLHVVPVEMTEQTCSPERLAVLAREPEIAKSCAEVEQHRVVVGDAEDNA